MFRTRICLGAAMLVLAICPVASAEATAEGAGALLETIQRYVGKPAAGEASSVTVTPDGQAYLVSVDLKKATRPLAGFGLQLDLSALSFHAAPQDDGTWRIRDVTIPAHVRFGVADQAGTFSFDGLRFDGVFDPKLAGFSSLTSTLARTVSERTTREAKTTVSYVDGSLTQTATAAAKGAANLRQHSVIGAVDESVEFLQTPRSAIRPGFGLTLKSSSMVGDLTIDALRGQALLNLWAYLVDHTSFAQVADAAGLRARLISMLPIFEKFDDVVTVHDFSVDSSAGLFSAKEIGLQIGGTGATVESHYETSWRASGVAVPPGLLKAWQKGLAPTDFDIGVVASGFDLDLVAREAIEALDFGDSQPQITAEGRDRILGALLDNGPIKIVCAPSHLVSAMLSIEASGSIIVAPGGTLVQFDVQAKGLDAAIGAVQAATSSDPAAVRAGQSLAMVKRLGKAGADGASSWHIEFATGGKFTVNGTPLGKP